jgi:hypothetical protein
MYSSIPSSEKRSMRPCGTVKRLATVRPIKPIGLYAQLRGGFNDIDEAIAQSPLRFDCAQPRNFDSRRSSAPIVVASLAAERE